MSQISRLLGLGVLAGQTILDCDIGRDGSPLLLVGEDDLALLLAPGFVRGPHRFVSRDLVGVRWLDGDTALLWTRDGAASLMRDGEMTPLGLIRPDGVFTGSGFVFASYGEERVLSHPAGRFDDDIVTVFDQAGSRLFGVASLLSSSPKAPALVCLEAGCAEGGRLAFLADGDPVVWLLDAASRTIASIRPDCELMRPASFYQAVALAGDEVRLLRLDGERSFVHRIASPAGRSTGIEWPGELVGAPIRGARGVAGGSFLIWTEHDVFVFDPGPAYRRASISAM